MAANESIPSARGPSPGEWARARLDELAEFFTLRWSEQRAEGLSADVRTTLDRDVSLAGQRRSSAELLHQHGSRAEALRLVASAYAVLLPHRELAGVAVDDALTAAHAELPVRDDELRAEHDELYERTLAAELALEGSLGPVALPKPERRRKRVTRVGVAFTVAVGLLYFVFSLARRVDTVVEASGSWGPKYAPENITDGNEQSSWLLPDRTLGWIDLKIASPKQLSMVSVLNNWDPPTYGFIDYRVEIWTGDKIVQQVDGTFPAPTAGSKPAWVDIPVTTKEKATKVRIVCKSYWNIGGGLAEVKLR